MTLDELESQCSRCTKCDLCLGRTNTVFGVGKKDADIMLIGEAPGENEDMMGQPFVGRSGKLLDTLLESVGLSRNKNVYIANMCKCRPPKNRDPKPDETAQCLEWLNKQIEIIDPKIIVCVGRISAQKLISPSYKVTQQHGEFAKKDGRLITATYHPAAILRNINNKPIALADWQAICEKARELGIEL